MRPEMIFKHVCYNYVPMCVQVMKQTLFCSVLIKLNETVALIICITCDTKLTQKNDCL
jgi:hypothetical protein